MRIYSLLGRVEEWLAERISWLGERYSDREIHKNGLEKKFSCRSVWIVITSL